MSATDVLPSEERANLVVTPAIQQYKVGPHLQYIEDPYKTLTVEDFVGSDRQPMRWSFSDEEVPNFGYTRATYWFHFNLLETNVGNSSWLLALSYSLLDQVTVYFAENGQVIRSYETGDSYAFNSRPIQHRHFLFPVPKVASDTLDIYLRVQTDGTLEMPLTLWERKSFWEHEQIVLMVKGLYFGVIFIMVIYNLFIYFSVRESSYLYYVCYASFLILFQTGIDGVAFQLFWPGNPAFHGMGFVIFSAFTLAFLCLFSNSFLKLPRYNPRLSKLLLFGALSTVLAAIAAVFLPYAYAIRLVVALSIPICIVCFGVGVFIWVQGASIARYFITAWSAFLIGVLLISLSKIGFLPINFFTTNSLQIGSALEVVLFSLALADRINADKKERLLAKQDAIKSLERFKSLYDNAIEGIFQCTLEGRFVSANPSMAKFMGYDSPETFIESVVDTESQIFLDMEQYHEFRKTMLEHGQVLNYEAHGMRRDGGHFWCAVSAKLVDQLGVGNPLIEGFVVDITARKKSEEQLNFLARHDPLTGLVNRREFEIRLDRAVKSAHRDHVTHTMLYMDLDQFKLVNDSCGHIAGDELLRQVTLQIQTHMRGGDTLARLGGDEFGVLLENCVGENATKVAHKLRLVIQEFRFSWESKIFTLGVSIGLVPIADDTESVKSVMSLADAACYAAKDAGRNRVHEYVPGDSDFALQQGEMQWASRITQALEEEGLILYKQTIAPIAPIESVELATSVSDQIEGEHMEILVRMQGDDEVVAPGAFLPAAERYNLMPSVDRWVVKNVFVWLSEDSEQLDKLSMCSINLSGLSIGDDDFSVFLAGLFEYYDVPAEKICFEITETIAVTNLTKAIEFMNRFKALGCRFSLDDFGSGFSSYGYLKNLPVDYLKIDGSFVKDIVDDEIDYAMVESINRIGHVMGKKTIAEFVENAEILQCLKNLGVDYAQGYEIAKPIPV